eukprot:934491-Pyramimonas_sp.AAC.1
MCRPACCAPPCAAGVEGAARNTLGENPASGVLRNRLRDVHAASVGRGDLRTLRPVASQLNARGPVVARVGPLLFQRRVTTPSTKREHRGSSHPRPAK